MSVRPLLSLVAAGVMLSGGCERVADPEGLNPDAGPSPGRAGGGIVHHVSAGGADVCEAVGLPTGCDANWSLVAIQYADGTVRGNWQDVVKFGGPGALAVHLSVDCLHVEGNHAWVGGVVTVPRDFAGVRFLTNVVDNGNSPDDAPDQIGLLESDGFYGPCTAASPDLFLFDLTHGQVTVW